MDPNCKAAVRAASGGKPVSDAKLAKIEESLGRNMTQLAKQDPTRWRGLSLDQKYAEGVQATMAEMTAAANRKEANALRQVLATQAVQDRIKQIRGTSKTNQSGGLIRDMEHTAHYQDAVRNDALSGLGDLIDAAGNKDGTGVMRKAGMAIFDLDNPKMTADVVREVFKLGDGSTGNKVAQAGARAWLDTIEALRLRFNAAGGDIGKLGYGYLSQAHDQVKVLNAGAEGWARSVLPLLDRSQYLTPDGARMSDADLMRVLEKAHDTIATGGLNKTAPGTFKGSGAKANAGSESRVLHFQDGDAWMQYMGQYGQGSLYDAMVGHVGTMARDIGLVERYGPNPEQQFKVQADIAQRQDGEGSWANRKDLNTPDSYWNLISGKTVAQNGAIAQFGQDVRNLQTAAKLGGAVLSSATDVGTIATTLHFNKLPYFDMLSNLGKQFDGETRDFLRTHGIIGESLTSTLNRWTGDNMTHSLTGRVAGSVMKLSLMNAWTDGLRNAFSMTMMGGMAKMAKKSWSQLDEWDRYLLERKGITEEDWKVVNQATPTKHQGAEYLTPRDIKAASVENARPADLQRVRDAIKERTEELSARNAQDKQWIDGRIDKFDEARDALNRQVKARAAKREGQAQDATGPLLERMALLDAQREAAKLQADMEADYNKLFTKADIDAFNDGLKTAATDLARANREGLTAAEKAGQKFGQRQQRLERQMRDAQDSAGRRGEANAERQLVKMSEQQASIERAAIERDIEIALKTIPASEHAAFRDAMAEVADVRRSATAGMTSAERIGRRYGEAKGRLDGRMLEIQRRIADLDKTATRETDADAKAAQAKTEAMAEELKEFTQRSQDRQKRRTAVIERLQSEEGARVQAESDRIRSEVATKVLAFTLDEAQFAVVNPDIATRAMVSGGGMPGGTIRGEAMRTFTQFKSFPIAMLTRHWRRILETPQGLQGAPAGFGANTPIGGTANKIATLAALNVTLTLLGAIVLQNKSLVSGKDPYDMTTPKFWSRAFTQGGGMGYVGDLIFKDPTEQHGSSTEQAVGAILGPAAGAAAGLAGDLIVTNAWEAAKGKPTKAGAETLRWVNSQIPGQSLWWTRGVWEHAFLHNAQEALNPGYLSRMKQRAQRDWKQGYWWEPGEVLPERLPDLEKAVGK